MSLGLPRVSERLLHSHQKHLQSSPVIDHHAKSAEMLVRHQDLPVLALAAVAFGPAAIFRRNLSLASVALAPVVVAPHADATRPQPTFPQSQLPLGG
jgi:hypothetical protein